MLEQVLLPCKNIWTMTMQFTFFIVPQFDEMPTHYSSKNNLQSPVQYIGQYTSKVYEATGRVNSPYASYFVINEYFFLSDSSTKYKD